jgi:3-oxoacyl-[acyl-carrier protein] reductase
MDMATSFKYANKYVLITGSSRGVGRLLSEYMIQNGAVVVGFSRGKPTYECENYHHISVDIGNPKSVQEGFAIVRKLVPTLHILINNAGVATSQYAMIMPPESAQKMLTVNIFGAFLMSKEASKLMRKNKWGRIINIGSIMSSLEPAGGSIYAATKAALISMSNVAAKELSPFNITSNTLALSGYPTDMMRALPPDVLDGVINSLVIPRLTIEDDIFNVIDFLASERSSYITAQTIYLGGIN